jgi:arginine transport system substrate-binding protein
MMKKIMMILFFTVCIVNLSFADVPEGAEPLTIRFVMEATYPPFEYMDAEGQVQGYDVDLANAICTVIHAKCTFSNQPFNSLIPSVQIGKYDAIISSLSVTDERKQQVNFTNSYYEPSAAFVASVDVETDLDHIQGAIIGVQQGSTFESYLKDKYPDHEVTIKKYASIQDAFLDLIAGRVDMVLADTPIIKSWLMRMDHGDEFTVVGKPIVNHTYFGSGYAIAVNKNNADLLELLNKGLAQVKKDGTLAKLNHTYFGR